MASKEPLLKSDEEEDLIFDQGDMVNSRHSLPYGKNDSSICGNSVSGRLQVARTINLCLSFFGLGLCFAIPTATLEDLQNAVGVDRSSIEYIYTARYGGYLFGSVLGGILFDRYNRQFLLFLSLLVTAIGIVIMPFCLQLAALMACTAITGITMGFLDTGGNVWCLDLWGKKSAPFMQALHFCFGFGAFVAPLVAEPFLSPHPNVTGIIGSDTLSNGTLLAPGISRIRIHRSSLLSDYNEILPWPEAQVWNSQILQDRNSEHNIHEFLPVHPKSQTERLSDIFMTSSFNAHGNSLNKRDISLISKGQDYNVSQNDDNEEKLNFTFVNGNNSKNDAGIVYSTIEPNSSHPLVKALTGSGIDNDMEWNASSTVQSVDITTLHRPLPKPDVAGGSLKHESSNPWQRPSLKKAAKDASAKLLSTAQPITNTSTTNANVVPTVSVTTPTPTPAGLNVESNGPKSNVTSTENSRGNSLVSTTMPHLQIHTKPIDATNETIENVHLLPTTMIPLSALSLSTVLPASSLLTKSFTRPDASTISQKPYSESSSSSKTTVHNMSATIKVNSSHSTVTPPVSTAFVITTVKSPSSSTSKPNEGSLEVHYRNDNTQQKGKEMILPQEFPRQENSSVHSFVPKTPTTEVYAQSNQNKDNEGKKMVHTEGNLGKHFYSTERDKAIPFPKSAIRDEHTTYVPKDNFPPSKAKYEDTPSPQTEHSAAPYSSHINEGPFTPSSPDMHENSQVTNDGRKNEGHGSGKPLVSLEDSSTLIDGIAINVVNKTQSNTSDHNGFDFLANWFVFMHRNRLGRFELPYVLLATYIFLVSVVFLIFLCLNPREPRTRQEEELDRTRLTTRTFKILLVGFASLFLCLYVGTQVAVGRLLQTFATTEILKLSTPRGYFLTYFFWGSFTVARGVSIAIAAKVRAVTMLFADMIICLLASIILVAGSDKLEVLLWVGIVFLGIGMASIFPTSIVWVERYMHVTNRTASAFILGAAFGEMVIPPVITRFINEEPMVLMYVNVTVNILCFANFIVLWLITSRSGEKYQCKPKRSLYQLANADEGEEDMEMCPPNARWQNDYNSHILSKRKINGTSPHYGGM